MTEAQMRREFKLFLDKVDSQALPDFTLTEIYIMLNEAQERFVKNRYGLTNIYKKGFEEIQKRTDDLNPLVKTKFTSVTAVTTETNTYKVDIDTLFSDEAHAVPSTDVYMFYLRGRARHTSAGCGSQYVSVELVQQDDLEEIMIDPFNKPYINGAVGYFEDNDIYVVTDGSYTITNFKLTFLKRPRLIAAGIDCELRDHTHKEIVQIAVLIALENIEAARQQTQAQQLNTIE
jgi:hypothetical protein